jgi:hypothetical protein
MYGMLHTSISKAWPDMHTLQTYSIYGQPTRLLAHTAAMGDPAQTPAITPSNNDVNHAALAFATACAAVPS